MHIDLLPSELVTDIFLALPAISSVIALSSTCHHFRQVYASSKRLRILSQAAENEFGPTQDIIQLVTHNSSQPAHLRRSVPLSEALLHSIVKVGRIARKWEEMYPFKKWKTDFENRRDITDGERFRLRRALYRLWLFSRAFHDGAILRWMRCLPALQHERTLLLHNFSSVELAEMLDVHNMLRDTISSNICPSNGTVSRKFQKRFPHSNYQLLFNTHLNLPPPSSFAQHGEYHCSEVAASKSHNKYTPTARHEPGAEGWGDDILHYYVVEDMLKLDPEQLIHLKENAPYKSQVEAYIKSKGDWFDNNGETFVQTLHQVIHDRGQDMDEFKDAIEDGEMGVALHS
ncbi:hypothetical protein AUEXF2481DRAFT_44893 [Aureobasidium subglaciale EXF-2481]|uniref:F-box domain-containing protein n=1 Tax=Aureobasidium subglaciale (strain EXF-2481) TaxID=1043005 RepID=A0A074XYS9_AURSE|nr:uncharacterized protein AUEXF2481DRAFT_44893 [Aureobasidium subglaciale EXF-2481]KAI5201469.1 hypothetical protein E4T38_06053 [Aureobasidium subglaciale]KAI5220115.1 hypothetical protein E4T40_06074 [Aureobasidium subglaciale]KAI5224033.1 hypothetical protein E4T41_05914 [Aureobasidium subglaciale]KAI5260652.1 hypothetical protein E4T46_05808 [Aureobasidium subglaciale]KEQ90698.1 hypothetical protein AUEXF2481DRAFT_44893 [Aureobasidium subglaciale EXF-2481]